MDIVFKGRHTDVLERFRKHATGKLAKIEKLDHKAIRVDVEVTAEHNPRQSGRKERVELTITTRGPAIRAEAAAEDRFAALDMALAKLESRLRRACDRRKARHGAHRPSGWRPAEADLASPTPGPVPAGSVPMSRTAPDSPAGMTRPPRGESARRRLTASPAANGVAPDTEVMLDDRVPIDMDGDGPLVVREKFHVACPMTIDQALFEMELVGHDFFLFTDTSDGLPSVVYRRRGYQYGVIRLVEERARGAGGRQAARQRAAPAADAAMARPAGQGSAIGAVAREPANLASRIAGSRRPARAGAGLATAGPGRREFEHCHRGAVDWCRAADPSRGRVRRNAHGPQRRGQRRGWPDLAGPARPEPIRTLIVDDHALFRRGLEMVLDSEPDIELVGEASDGEEAVEQGRRVAARRGADGHPDAAQQRDRGLPGAEGRGAERQDRDADDQRRGRGPVRGDQGRRQRLPAQGHPAGRGGRHGAGRATAASR